MLEGLSCLKCGEKDRMQLHFAEDVFYCSSCEETLDIDWINKALTMWAKVIEWVNTAPRLPS